MTSIQVNDNGRGGRTGLHRPQKNDLSQLAARVLHFVARRRRVHVAARYRAFIMRARLTAGHVTGPGPSLLSRRQVVESCHRQLEREGHPRLHMTLLVALTAGVGWLASGALLASGVDSMWLRYPAAICLAYVAFLFFLWVWLRRHDVDVPDVCIDGVGQATPPHGRCSGGFEGSGGQFGGGGASGSFDGASTDATGSSPDAGASDLGAGEALGAADELAVPLVALAAAVALVLGLALVSVYVVYTAPSLLAELTVDAALSYTLTRRLKHGQRRPWLATAVARTWWPALSAAACAAAVGAALAIWAPGTTSLAAALRHLLGA